MGSTQKELPTGWKWVPISEVCEVTDYVANGSFASLKQNVQYREVPDYAVLVRLKDFNSNWDQDNFVYVDRHAYEFLGKSSLSPGDVVICNVGSIGQSFIVPDLGIPVTLGPNSVLVKPLDQSRIISSYIYLWSKSPNALSFYAKNSTATTQPKFNKTNLRKEVIPLPPLEEQKRIAEILNKAEELKKLREEADRKTEELIPAIFHEMFGDSVNSETRISTLKEIGLKIIAGKSYSTDDDVDSAPYKVLKTSAVSWGDFDAMEVKALPFDYVPPEDHIIQKYDILVSRMNTPSLVGASVLVSESHPKLAVPDRLWRLVVPETAGLTQTYLWAFLNHPSTRAEITAISSGTSSSMKNISQAKFLALNVPLPSLDLQMKFVENVSAIVQLRKTKEFSNNLMSDFQSSLLQKAFRGEL